MKKRLAIIGASYLQLPLVRKAKEMGLETHCFAWEKGAVCKNEADHFYPISTIDKEAVFKECQKIGIDGITTIATDIAVPTVCYVAAKMGLISNSYESSAACTNKVLMRQRFVKNKVNSPGFIAVGDREKPDVSVLSFPLIVKPVDRSGSLGVLKVEKKEDLQRAIERARDKSFAHQAIVEEFVDGQEVSVESISWEGKHYILAITDKVTTGAPYFVEIAHHQPSALEPNIQKKINAETKKALDALNVRIGASHSEFKITSEGDVYAVEVGARMGGGFIGSDLVYLSTGYDFLKATIEVALGGFSEPVLPLKKCSGVYFLCKETEYLKPYIQEKNKEYMILAEITNDILRSVQCGADRSGFLIYQAEKKIIIDH